MSLSVVFSATAHLRPLRALQAVVTQTAALLQQDTSVIMTSALSHLRTAGVAHTLTHTHTHAPAWVRAEVAVDSAAQPPPMWQREIDAVDAPVPSAADSVLDPGAILLVKRTFSPHALRRKRTHGFLGRNATTSGRKVLSARRQKGRKRVSV